MGCQNKLTAMRHYQCTTLVGLNNADRGQDLDLASFDLDVPSVGFGLTVLSLHYAVRRCSTGSSAGGFAGGI